LKRLRRAEAWFRPLGVSVLQEQGRAMPQAHSQLRLRLGDSTPLL
jgi:hypothetical protein